MLAKIDTSVSLLYKMMITNLSNSVSDCDHNAVFNLLYATRQAVLTVVELRFLSAMRSRDNLISNGSLRLHYRTMAMS